MDEASPALPRPGDIARPWMLADVFGTRRQREAASARLLRAPASTGQSRLALGNGTGFIHDRVVTRSSTSEPAPTSRRIRPRPVPTRSTFEWQGARTTGDLTRHSVPERVRSRVLGPNRPSETSARTDDDRGHEPCGHRVASR